MERFFENAMYASRWLLAPVYFGLSLALVALSIKFFQEIFHVLPDIFSIAEADLILVLLSLGGVMTAPLFFGLTGVMGLGNGICLPNANAGILSVRPAIRATRPA